MIVVSCDATLLQIPGDDRMCPFDDSSSVSPSSSTAWMTRQSVAGVSLPPQLKHSNTRVFFWFLPLSCPLSFSRYSCLPDWHALQDCFLPCRDCVSDPCPLCCVDLSCLRDFLVLLTSSVWSSSPWISHSTSPTSTGEWICWIILSPTQYLSSADVLESQCIVLPSLPSSSWVLRPWRCRGRTRCVFPRVLTHGDPIPVHDESLQFSNRLGPRCRDDVGHESYFFNSCFWPKSSVQLLSRSKVSSRKYLQHSTSKLVTLACFRGDQAWYQRTDEYWRVPIDCFENRHLVIVYVFDFCLDSSEYFTLFSLVDPVYSRRSPSRICIQCILWSNLWTLLLCVVPLDGSSTSRHCTSGSCSLSVGISPSCDPAPFLALVAWKSYAPSVSYMHVVMGYRG